MRGKSLMMPLALLSDGLKISQHWFTGNSILHTWILCLQVLLKWCSPYLFHRNCTQLLEGCVFHSRSDALFCNDIDYHSKTFMAGNYKKIFFSNFFFFFYSILWSCRFATFLAVVTESIKLSRKRAEIILGFCVPCQPPITSVSEAIH